MALDPVDDAAGLPARRLAFSALKRVLDGRTQLDEAFDALRGPAGRMPPRDAAHARAIVYAALRRKGALEAAIAACLERPLPEHGRDAHLILLAAAAELLVLEAAPHAAVDLAVKLAAATADARGFKGLVNAVARRLAREGRAILAGLDPGLDTPAWLRERWTAAYGAEAASALAAAHAAPAPLDLTLKAPGEAEAWAARLGAGRVGVGALRLPPGTDPTALPGYAEGAWWVQDAAAAMPARVLLDALPDPASATIVDLCAAPGGKTMQLAASGARVAAVDSSTARMKRLEENLARTGLRAQAILADARVWRPERPADAVLLDAPCSATGTIRRHPDLPWIKGADDVRRQAAAAARLLDAAGAMVAPGGVLVLAVCSLEPEEGETQTAAFLDRTPGFVRERIDPATLGLPLPAATDEGELRLRPDRDGMDGFFVARLRRAD